MSFQHAFHYSSIRSKSGLSFTLSSETPSAIPVDATVRMQLEIDDGFADGSYHHECPHCNVVFTINDESGLLEKIMVYQCNEPLCPRTLENLRVIETPTTTGQPPAGESTRLKNLKLELSDAEDEILEMKEKLRKAAKKFAALEKEYKTALTHMQTMVSAHESQTGSFKAIMEQHATALEKINLSDATEETIGNEWTAESE